MLALPISSTFRQPLNLYLRNMYLRTLCFRLIGLFLDTESGHHVRHPVIKYVKVHAFRFEPLEPRGIVDVDGEV